MTHTAGSRRHRTILGIPAWIVKTVPIVVVVVLAAFSVTVVSTAQANKDNSTDAFNASTYAQKTYESKIVPAVIRDAVDLATLLTGLDTDAAATEKKYGHTSGANSPYSFSITTTGVAGAVNKGLLPLTVEGIAKPYTVFVQIGPEINGTALRDATGLVSFGQFVNQIDYQNAALALNDQVKEKVLKGLDPAALVGKTVTVTGAYATSVNPGFIGIVPIAIETAP